MKEIALLDSSSVIRDAIACILSLILHGGVLFLISYSTELFPQKTAVVIPIEILFSQAPAIQDPARLPAPHINPASNASTDTAYREPNLKKQQRVPKQPSQDIALTQDSTSDAASMDNLPVPAIEAQVIEEIKPEIPNEIRSQEYKSYVRVKVEINSDGIALPSLKTSSGNEKVDSAVLTALKRWRWKPAILNGSPTRSVRYFRFEFEVR